MGNNSSRSTQAKPAPSKSLVEYPTKETTNMPTTLKSTVQSLQSLQVAFKKIDKKIGAIEKRFRDQFVQLKERMLDLMDRTLVYARKTKSVWRRIEKALEKFDQAICPDDMAKLKKQILDEIFCLNPQPTQDLFNEVCQLRKDMVNFKNELGKQVSSKKGLWVLIGAVVGAVVAIGVAVACPFLLPLELAIGAALVGAGTLAGVGIAAYKVAREQKMIKKTAFLMRKTGDLSAHLLKIRNVYNQILGCYEYVLADAQGKERKLDSDEIESIIDRIKEDCPNVLGFLTDLENLAMKDPFQE